MASGKMDTMGLLATLFDAGAYTTMFEPDAAVTAAYGMVGGQGAYAVCQTGSTMGAADVKMCRRVLELASVTGNPVVTFYDAPGLKLEDGVNALAEAKKLAAAAAKLSGVVPQIAVVTGVCGASSALAAASADICVMAQGAELFLSSPFLSAAAGDKKEDAGTAAAAAKAGIASVVVEDAASAAKMAAQLVMLLPANNLAEASAFEYDMPAAAFPATAYTGKAAVEALADAGSAVELFDGFGNGVTTCLCTLNGNVVGIVATNGADTYLGDRCAARAARFARLCDAYSIPLVTVLNSGGFAVSSTGDEAGAMRQAARLAATYADLTTARVAVLAGKTYGTLYTAMASADLTVAVEGSLTAPVVPTAAVSVLYKEEIENSDKSIDAATAELAKKYEAEVASAAAVQKAGLADFVAAAGEVRSSVAAALAMLATKRAQRMPKKHGNMPL